MVLKKAWQDRGKIDEEIADANEEDIAAEPNQLNIICDDILSKHVIVVRMKITILQICHLIVKFD